MDPNAQDGSQDDLLIRIVTDSGIQGIGEVDASPEVVQAVVKAPTSHATSNGLRKLLLGENPLDVERLWEKMYRGSLYYGRRGVTIAALSGVDIALWDVVGKAEAKPVSEILFANYRKKIRVYASLYPIGDTPDRVRTNARNALSKGFHAVKLDGPPLGEDDDLDRQLIAAARGEIGDDNDLLLDVAEPGWDLKTAVSRARMYSNYNVYLLEAPFGPDDLESYRKLSEKVDVRVAYGEQYSTRHEFKDLIERGKVDVIQPDVSRAGGITELRRIAKIAETSGVLMIPHCWKTGISIAANLHLLSAMHDAPFLEFSLPPVSPLRYDLLKRDFDVENGYLEVPDGPGLGIELNEKTVQKYRTDA